MGRQDGRQAVGGSARIRILKTCSKYLRGGGKGAPTADDGDVALRLRPDAYQRKIVV